MSTQIDFNDPSLFGVRNGDLQSEPLYRPARVWPRFVLVFVVAIVLAAIVMFITRLRPPQTNVNPLHSPDVASSQEISWTGSPKMASEPVLSVSGPSRRWCDGDEVICTTATSMRPAETLHKLILALPKASAKRYEIRLSVTALEEPAQDQAAATPADIP